MSNLRICRACLACSVPVYDILHTRYQDALERITSISLTETNKPHALCAPCLEILDKCCTLQEKSAAAERLLIGLLKQNQLTEDAIKSIDRQQHKLVDFLPTFTLVPIRASEGMVETIENVIVKIEPFDTQTREDLTDYPEPSKNVPTKDPPNHKISLETVDDLEKTPYIQIDAGGLLNSVKREVNESSIPGASGDSLIQIDVEMQQTEYNNILENKRNIKEHIQKITVSKDIKVSKTIKPKSKTNIEAYLKKCSVDNRKLKRLPCDKSEIKCEHKTIVKPSKKQVSEESHACSECEYKTYSKKNLIYHMKRHTNELLICATCGYKCATKSRLVSHIRIHTKERPYQCNVCGKNFTEVGTLSKHFNYLHKGVKAFKCMWCDYGAATKSHLDRHIQRHTGDKRFKCELCDYACVQKWDLKRHVKTHENNGIRYKRVAPVIVRIVSMAETK